MKKIVVIGGGTGTATVIAGLKSAPVAVTALVSVADSGGSTGRLRDEFGFQPVGDLRQSLAALAGKKSQEWIRKLLLYRFEKGKGLKGHNLGNLILTALQDMAGSTTSALEIAERIFALDGKIYPVTTQNVQLVIEYVDGSVVIGEDALDDNASGSKKIRRIRLSPRATIYEKADKAIQTADLIVIGPGDYYASIMAALAVSGIKQSFAHTRANIVYIVNLMTRLTQTHHMSASGHLKGVEKAIGRPCDVVIINCAPIPQKVLEWYAAEQEFPVKNDLSGGRCRLADVLSGQTHIKSTADSAHRSILRHDANKLANALLSILNNRIHSAT